MSEDHGIKGTPIGSMPISGARAGYLGCDARQDPPYNSFHAVPRVVPPRRRLKDIGVARDRPNVSS
jgi:hypothetical protein